MHDGECERDTPHVNPVTGKTIVRETCQCRHRREKRSHELEEQPVVWSWLHGSSGVVPGP